MRRMGDILLDRGLIKKEQLEKALELQKTTNKYLGQILLEMNIISEEVLTDIQSSILGLKVISTKALKIHPKIIQFIPQSIAIKYRIVPIYIEPNAGKNILCMVTSEEPPAAVINKMSEKLNVPIKIFLATYSELEDLLVKHYGKPKESIALNKKQIPEIKIKENKTPPTPDEEAFEEEILTGDIIEDDDEPVITPNRLDLPDLTPDFSPNKEEKQTLNNNTPKQEDNHNQNGLSTKSSSKISLELDITPQNIKSETPDIKDLPINENIIPNEAEKNHTDSNKEEPLKKLNFLEAFKNEDSYVFDDNKQEEYVSVEIPEENDEIQELDVSDVDLFDDIIEEPKDKDSIKENSNTPPLPNKKEATPPPLKDDTDIPLPIPPGNPDKVDKSGFPPPKIRKFKDESENDTNPGTTEKISLNEKKATDEWLKKNKNREIPDLDFIFGEEESKDPLNNSDIDKILLSKKLENLKENLIKFLEDKKIKKNIINKFKRFFDNLEKNPSDIILISMLEMIMLNVKPDLDLFLELIVRNIKNDNSGNKKS